jgi:CheY-like chemotaxis protein
VVQASNGQDAIRQVALLAPDLILMDLSMPTLDGYETSRLIRRNALSTAPIIVISANAFTDDRERSIAAACNDYLAKPVRTGTARAPATAPGPAVAAPHQTFVAPPPPGVLPSAEDLAALAELSAIGYVRGLHEKLDTILEYRPDTEPFISKVRGLLKGFRLDELNRTLKEAEDECTHPQH